MEHFGEHLMIDGYGGDEALLDSKAVVQACLDVEAVKDFFQKAFELAELEVQFVKRGTRYPEQDLV